MIAREDGNAHFARHFGIDDSILDVKMESVIPRRISAGESSFLLLGPRGTGKSTWVRATLGTAPYFDLLDGDTYVELLSTPSRLEQRIPPKHRGWVVIDEIQKVPALLDQVHRLIETRRLRFALTGSSARKLRRGGVNLLAGRARSLTMHPLTCQELGPDFDLRKALDVGLLPMAHTATSPQQARAYLRSYVQTYLREEVQQEGLTRNVAAFGRFLEAASLSQGSVLNVSAIARDCHVDRKVVEAYFGVLEDLLLSVRLPVFSRRAKRRIVAHPKFYLFDTGVFRTLRPRGPLDAPEEIDGAALETLFLQELRALIDYDDLDYTIHYWRTPSGSEVDFVLYGERGLKAFEIKRSARLRPQDLAGVNAFLEDYPRAEAWIAYGGTRSYGEGPVSIVPFAECLRRLPELL